MKKYFNVTFRWYETNAYCYNIAHAETAEDVIASYTAEGLTLAGEPTVCRQYQVESAQLKGIPIVEI